MKNFIQVGNTLSFIANADVESGGVVVVGALAGISATKVSAGMQGEATLTGVYELPKVTNAAIAPGVPLYWNGTKVTETDTDNTFIGHSAELAEVAAAFPSIAVRLAQSN